MNHYDNFSHSRLDNGVEILSRHLPHTASAALGLWIENGSRDQQADEDGLAHLLEHMLFKGTQQHSAAALTDAMEPLGGNINAFTDRELTAYHATVLAEDLPAAFALLQDMVCHATLPSAELTLEKRVVAQEAAAVSEDNEEWIQEQLSRAIWGHHPLGWPVLGRPSVIRRASRKQLDGYYRRHYVGQRIKVVAAGAITHEALHRLAQQYLAALPQGEPRPATPAPCFQPGQHIVRRPHTEQAHLLWAAPGIAVDAASFYQISLANLLLGGSAGSQLFRQVRDQNGLAYAVYSHLECFRDAGEWRIYAATAPDQVNACVDTVEQVLQQLIADGPSADAVARGKRHLRAQLLMGLEEPEAQMQRLARQWLYLGHIVPVAESLAALEQLSPQSLRDCFASHWAQCYRLQCLPHQKSEKPATRS